MKEKVSLSLKALFALMITVVMFLTLTACGDNGLGEAKLDVSGDYQACDEASVNELQTFVASEEVANAIKEVKGLKMSMEITSETKGTDDTVSTESMKVTAVSKYTDENTYEVYVSMNMNAGDSGEIVSEFYVNANKEVTKMYIHAQNDKLNKNIKVSMSSENELAKTFIEKFKSTIEQYSTQIDTQNLDITSQVKELIESSSAFSKAVSGDVTKYKFESEAAGSETYIVFNKNAFQGIKVITENEYLGATTKTTSTLVVFNDGFSFDTNGYTELSTLEDFANFAKEMGSENSAA